MTTHRIGSDSRKRPAAGTLRKLFRRTPDPPSCRPQAWAAGLGSQESVGLFSRVTGRDAHCTAQAQESTAPTKRSPGGAGKRPMMIGWCHICAGTGSGSIIGLAVFRPECQTSA